MNGIFAALTTDDLKRIAIVLLLIFFNFLFAVVGALMKGGFDPTKGGLDVHKLPEFVYNQILPYIVGLAFFEAFLHLLPPSTLVAGLFPAPATVSSPIPGLPVTEPNGWQWLDPAVLWLAYGAIVVDLAKKTVTNLMYLFGKTISVAQGIQAKYEKPA